GRRRWRRWHWFHPRRDWPNEWCGRRNDGFSFFRFGHRRLGCGCYTARFQLSDALDKIADRGLELADLDQTDDQKDQRHRDEHSRYRTTEEFRVVHNPVGESMNSQGRLNRSDKWAASALTPRVSVA